MKNEFFLAIATLLFIIVSLYPPFHVVAPGGVIYNMGYSFIFSPPEKIRITATIDIAMLLVHWAMIGVVTGSIIILKNMHKQSSLTDMEDSEQPTVTPIITNNYSKKSTAIEAIFTKIRKIQFKRWVYKVLALIITVLMLALGKLAGRAASDIWSSYQIDRELKITSDEMNQSLPKMIDNVTKLDSVSASSDKELTFNLSIPSISWLNIDKNKFCYDKFIVVAGNSCKSQKISKILRKGATVYYLYNDKDSYIIASMKITKEVCSDVDVINSLDKDENVYEKNQRVSKISKNYCSLPPDS
jgi:hypothetical protein